MKKQLLSLLALMLVCLAVNAQTINYSMVTSTSELYAGAKVILVGYNDSADSAFIMSYQKSSNRHAIYCDQTGNSISISVAAASSSQTEAYEFTIGGGNGAWTFFDELNNGYLYAPGGGNYLKTQANNNENGQWNLTIDNGACVPTSNGGVEQCYMHFNINRSGTPLFGCYKSTSNVTAPVYIFMAGGAPVVDPEPTSYPTNFAATLDLTSVKLSWDASTGEQLPKGYLILGSTSSIAVPQDGTPVANDLNAADGTLAFNVLYGTNEVTFNQLPSNATINFAIFPYTNSQSTIDYKNDGNYPTASVTTGSTSCIVFADFANGLAPFNAFNIEGPQEWTTSIFDNVPFAKMSGYADGASVVNEDWLISPNIFALGRYQTVVISFTNAYKYDGDALRVVMSTEYDGISDPTEFDWTEITDEFQWSAGNYEWQESGEYQLNNINSNSLYFAFIYTSTSSAASTWELTNVVVIGDGFDTVDENPTVAFTVYPNPAADYIVVNSENECELMVFDAVGRTLINTVAVMGKNTIDVSSFETGIYFIKMNGSVVRFVKE
ncbi:MAG: T9SS type A sorting domain-containing protein [Candidatus Limimorpha sp.]